MVFLKPEEEQFVTQEAISSTLTGSGSGIIEKLEEMEANGVDNVAISVTDAQGARELIQDFGIEVIVKVSVGGCLWVELAGKVVKKPFGFCGIKLYFYYNYV